MNIEEISINDWLYIGAMHERVREVAYDENMKPYVSFAASSTLFRSYLDDVQPIPLTEGFLVKNNIEFIEDNIYGIFNSGEDYGVELTRCGDWWRVVMHKEVKGGLTNNIILYGVKYVHELQQMLRISKLAELADEFKVV